MFVRSDAAHGELRSVHIDEAVDMDGVAAVFTADTLGVAPHHGFVTVHADFVRPPLATDRVRFVGEPIALVVADTREHAVDAASTVWADVDPLDPLIDPHDALASELLLFPAHGSNEAMANVDRGTARVPAAR